MRDVATSASPCQRRLDTIRWPWSPVADTSRPSERSSNVFRTGWPSNTTVKSLVNFGSRCSMCRTPLCTADATAGLRSEACGFNRQSPERSGFCRATAVITIPLRVLSMSGLLGQTLDGRPELLEKRWRSAGIPAAPLFAPEQPDGQPAARHPPSGLVYRQHVIRRGELESNGARGAGRSPRSGGGPAEGARGAPPLANGDEEIGVR